MSAPSSFECRTAPGALLWVRRGVELPSEANSWLQSGATNLETLAGEACGKGRGTARKIRLGELEGVWRKNLHGGLLRNVFGGHFLDVERLTEEVVVSETLRAQGVLTPKVLLAFAQRRGPFWQQHLVTEEVSSAETIFEVRDNPVAILKAMELLESLFQLGFWATDLHPANLLWQAEDERCWLIDLAMCSFLGRPLNPVERTARLHRFRRYFQKHGGSIPDGVTLSPNR
ncbi:MAG: lipopolysaccharide kinase InaA family protein [Planctomycetota bacterium]|nr:lipopolysaccharide kinase InaA family protein [Planctomycetota bacterium]MDP6941548.1 lipopolysaccharide kinase InaA family protein [Planctomycetota bacterium]